MVSTQFLKRPSFTKLGRKSAKRFKRIEGQVTKFPAILDLVCSILKNWKLNISVFYLIFMIIKSGSWSNFLLKMSSRQSLASLRYICMLGSLKSDDDDDPRTTEIRGQGSRCPNPSEIGHFTLLFCRGQLRNVQRFITHVHSYCFLIKSFVWWGCRWRCRRGLLEIPNVLTVEISWNPSKVNIISSGWVT